MADLVGIRELFVSLSGRLDLVLDTTDYADNGADYYIKAGQRELDREAFQTMDSYAIKYKNLSANSFVVEIPNVRAVKTIFFIDSGGDIKELEPKYYDWLRGEYGSLYSSLDSGDPTYWTPINLRHSPDVDSLESGEETGILAILGSFDIVSSNYINYDGALILPAPETAGLLEIHGLFYSDELSEDTDTNYWSAKEPDILVMAAMRELERSYRNNTGVKEWSGHISKKLSGIDMDMVEYQTSFTSKMNG